ncbi:MAG: hypothetical protein QOH36_1378 [Actinomycetota bacterium]|nr:hypothetical protein [Actinomycetota bacterium]
MREFDRTQPAPEDYVVTGGGERGPTDRRRLLVASAVVALVAAVIIVPRLTADPESGGDVRTGVKAELPAISTSVPLPPRIELQLPAGWQTLLADGEQLVVATAPLDERDLLLALLASDDAVFTAFPPTVAVFVVGGDRLKAKYLGSSPSAVVTQTENGVEIREEDPAGFVGPGPARALGPPTLLEGGVTVRLGDLPQSSSTLAAYVGPEAPEAVTQEAETMAATVRLRPYDPALIPPPPPESRPGFDQGGVDTAAEDLVPVASVQAAGLTYTARADADCADVVAGSSTAPLVGGCRPRPATTVAVEVVASGSALGPPPPPPARATGRVSSSRPGR